MTDTPDIDGGDNAAPVAAAQLKAFVERIERLSEEKKAIAEDIKEVFAEAKGAGYDGKALKAVLKIRSDPKAYAETQSVIETYAIALGLDIFS